MSQRSNHRNVPRTNHHTVIGKSLRGGGVASLGLIFALLLLITSGGAG